MTPIEFWDLYIGSVNLSNGGPPVDKMTLDKAADLKREIEKRLKEKGVG